MAKKPSEPKSIDIDAEVKKALLKIATADGPMRFVGKGDHDVVFAKNDATAKAVVEKCTSTENPLVEVVGTAAKQKVEVTAAGLKLVLGEVPEDKAVNLVGIAAGKQTLEDRMVFFREVTEKLPIPESMIHDLITRPLEEKKHADEQAKAAAMLEIEKEARRKHSQDLFIQASQKYAEAVQHERSLKKELLLAQLKSEGISPPPGGATPVAPVPMPEGHYEPLIVPFPTDGNANELRRKYALIVAGAWYDAASKNQTDVAKSLRRVLRNVGNVDLICDPGDVVPFDPTLHECNSACATGDSVRVIYSGWLLREAEGAYILRKAIVEQ